MTSSYYLYSYNPKIYGKCNWWYDEYDNSGKKKGYLGIPVNEAYLTDISSNLLSNGDFEEDMTSWTGWHLFNKGSTKQDCANPAYSGKCSVKCTLETATNDWEFQLFQTGFQIIDKSPYLVSFWAKSATPRVMSFRICKHTEGYNALSKIADNEVSLTNDWQFYEIGIDIDIPTNVENPISNPTVPDDTRFAFYLGQDSSTTWIDDVKLHKGGVYRRDFENDIVLCNISNQTKTVPLYGTYYRIKGGQNSSVNNGLPCNEITLNGKDGIILLTAGSIAGDINADNLVTLDDAILTLKVLCSYADSGNMNTSSDVNKDEKIGLEEAVYILQKISELKN